MIYRLLLIVTLAITASARAQDSSARVVHNDPSTYRQISAVHAGAGQMGFTQLIGRNDLSTNFLYLHAGVIDPKSGIGHHFHHSIEEMYVLLTGEAEFTINGRSSKIKAPALVPCKLGDSHAIYNAGSQPVKWLNFAVSRVKGRGDNFDLGDTRKGAQLDAIPVFVSDQLKKENLSGKNHPYEKDGLLFRRIFGPEIFSTNWYDVEHLLIPAGKSETTRLMESTEEVYYVLNGSGKLTLDSRSWDIVKDDAFSARLGEKIQIANNGSADLELLVVSISPAKDKTAPVHAAGKPAAMVLQMDFVVPAENKEAFEKMYRSIYVPAMIVQEGYLESKLLKLFPDEVSKSIQAEPTTYNYQIQISFDTEEHRRKWVASNQHQIAWPAASGLATSYKWRGYDVMGDDDQRQK